MTNQSLPALFLAVALLLPACGNRSGGTTPAHTRSPSELGVRCEVVPRNSSWWCYEADAPRGRYSYCHGLISECERSRSEWMTGGGSMPTACHPQTDAYCFTVMQFGEGYATTIGMCASDENSCNALSATAAGMTDYAGASGCYWTGSHACDSVPYQETISEYVGGAAAPAARPADTSVIPSVRLWFCADEYNGSASPCLETIEACREFPGTCVPYDGPLVCMTYTATRYDGYATSSHGFFCFRTEGECLAVNDQVMAGEFAWQDMAFSEPSECVYWTATY